MILGFGNNVTAKLTSDITSLQTEIPIDVGSGNLFAKLLTTNMSNEDTSHKIFAKVTLTNLQGSVSEICHLTAVSGDTLTVIRGQEGTVSRGWRLGDVVANFATRGSENTFVQIEQLQGGDYAYATALGTANNLVVNLPSTYTTDSWDLKTPIVITPIYNNSGQVTMQLILGGSVIGTFPIYKDNNSPLVRNDIIAGIPFLVLLDKTKTFFNIINGNYLSLTGGTVTGDTNFTAKLQNKGNDVATTNQLPKTEYWYVGGSKDSPLIVESKKEYVFNNIYENNPVIFIPQLYIDKTKSTDGKSRWVEINGRFDDSRVNDGLSFKTAEVVNDNGISYEVGIIVALSSIVAKNDRLSQIPKQWIDVNVTRAPFRVKVIKLA